MKNPAMLGSLCWCLLACGAPDPGGSEEPTGEATNAITLPDDPLFSLQWGLRNTGQLVPWTTFDDEQTFLVAGVRGVDINAAEAWDTTQGSSAVKVGVAETTDLDVTHEDLRDQIFRNRNEVAGDGIDNDGNGCIDDDRGCDFVNGDGVYGPFLRHGTHVAGIVAGRIENAKGIAGVAPKIKLVPLTSQVQNQSFISAIAYAEATGIRIINCSQGGHESEFFNPAVRTAMASSNLLFVCSAGNRGTPRLNFPSSYPSPNVLSVANVTNIGELSDHSSYGPDHVDIAAPGRSILSSVPGNDYDYMDGTSQAAPHVAGVAALLMKKFPHLSAVDVAERIRRTAMRMTTLSGMVSAAGMVDARAALEDVGPLELSATSQPGRIVLAWKRLPGATRYEVERDGTTIVNNGSSTTHVHAGLALDSGHIYRVRAFTGSKTGEWSHRLMAKASRPPFSQNVSVQSPHPYPNDFSQSYTVTKLGATRLRVHFSRVDTLPGDAIEYLRAFQDEREAIDEQISGSYPNGFWTHWVDGDTFFFSLIADGSGSAFGFRVDRIEYFTN